ncbi:conserved hypothetical protein [Culex quinquefasciatus]|uniref:Uncharacterized protein n=1 Tax=Culex quinquefasciatus TaxID=7176 RepID=B0XLX9_CULQU|nr:conserved hypothetical protein [Culex quinquefasciatus]|eukprot:XP_001870650.1 conserved hypothetical protein [Culex quinquefasciatus]
MTNHSMHSNSDIKETEINTKKQDCASTQAPHY